MSWMAVITMLVWAITSAILVMNYGWTLWEVLVMVSGVVALFGLALVVLLKLSPAKDQADLLSLIKTEMRKELKALLAQVRGK